MVAVYLPPGSHVERASIGSGLLPLWKDGLAVEILAPAGDSVPLLVETRGSARLEAVLVAQLRSLPPNLSGPALPAMQRPPRTMRRPTRAAPPLDAVFESDTTLIRHTVQF